MGFVKRDLEPVILKFGVVLAVSVGGILYSLLRNKRSKASKSLPNPRTRSDCNNGMNSRNNRQASPTATSSLHFDPLATEKCEELHHSTNPICDLSLSTKANTEIESHKSSSRTERDTQEQEIKSLRNSVKILKERERNLEIELLEYYGQREQETAVMELQNRLKLYNMEVKVFACRIESLQTDNKRLHAQMTDYTKTVADLEDARAKIKLLKKKHKSEAEHHKKQILDFQQRVQRMQDNDHKHMVEVDPNIESSTDKLKSLEAKVEDLRKSNDSLELEKSDLAHRLDCVQLLATSVLEDGETEKLKEENENLKKQNEDMSQEIERLRADKCADVEELVYLRWINACLRYELRNYKPGPDETTARDLSKTLSPKSEQKAKQMILEYANKESGGEDNINVPEIDSNRPSRSRSEPSLIVDSEELHESFIDDQLPQKNTKFLGKLMRMLKGKDNHSHSHHHNHHRNQSINSSTTEDVNSFQSTENHKLKRSLGERDSYNHSMDSQRLTNSHSHLPNHQQNLSINSSTSEDMNYFQPHENHKLRRSLGERESYNHSMDSQRLTNSHSHHPNHQQNLSINSSTSEDINSFPSSENHKLRRSLGERELYNHSMDSESSHSHYPNHHRNLSINSSTSEDMNSVQSSENHKLRRSLGERELYNHSTDSQRLTHRHSEACVNKKIDSIAEDGGSGSCSSSSHGKKSELAKYANALKDKSPAPNVKLHKTSQSLDFLSSLLPH